MDVYVGWEPASTSAMTAEGPAAHDAPVKEKVALPSSSMVAVAVEPVNDPILEIHVTR